MIHFQPSTSPGEAGYYRLRIDLCVALDEGLDVIDVLNRHGLVHEESDIFGKADA